MNQSNNVKFVEADGKWLWKRYDENGSATYRSPLFNTEREAREDYQDNGDKGDVAKEMIDGAKDIHVVHASPEDRSITGDTTVTPSVPEDTNTAGTATTDENQEKQPEDNGVGQATI